MGQMQVYLSISDLKREAKSSVKWFERAGSLTRGIHELQEGKSRLTRRTGSRLIRQSCGLSWSAN